MSTYNRLTYRLLLVAVGIFLTVSLWAQADASPRDFRRHMTSLKQQTERQNLLSNYPRVEALLAEADSLMTARRALGLAVEGKTEADFLKLRGDYYYWLALGAGETDAAHKADSCYTACLITYRTRFLPMPDTVVLLNQLGQLYYTRQDYAKALAYLQSAAESRTPYTSPRERQNARMGVAMCQARLGDYPAALATLDSCRDDKNIRRMRAKTLCLSVETGYNARKAVLPQAGQLYRDYVEAIRTEADSVFRTLLPDERERWWVAIRPFITDCWRLEDEEAALLYDVALLSKGILLQLCRDMQADNPEARTRALHLTWQDIQQALAPRDIAVEWLEYERGGVHRLGAVAVKKTGKPFFIPLCETDTLLQLRLRNGRTVEQAIASSYARDKEMLYNDLNIRNLFRSFFAAGKGTNNIWFAPDGMLHLLGIEYLSDNESLRLHRLTSTRQLTEQALPLNARALIVGGIDYDATLPTGDLSTAGDSLALHFLAQKTQHITPLAHTLTEAETVYQLRANHSDRILRRNEAQEQAFRSLSSEVGLIHLSTHGFFYGELQSGNSDFPLPQQTDAALSQSGLLFAGINPSLQHPEAACATNDGLLSSRELSTLHLDSVALFVVCACQGGMGRVTHDGVFGVQRGLKSAGVKAMVVSLWKVDDEASARFMSALHQRLKDGAETLGEAFRLARHDLRYYSPEGATEEDFDPEDDELFPYAAPYFANAFILIER